MGGVRDRPGRHHPGDRHRPVRRVVHGRGRHSGHRPRGHHRADRLPVHGRIGRAPAAPDGRHAVLRLRELRAARAHDGEAHRRRVRLGVLARLVPRGAHQHAAGRGLYRRALPRPAGPHLLAARNARHAGLNGRARHHLRRSDRAVHSVLLRDQARSAVRHRPRGDVHGAADPVDHSPDLQAVQLPLVEHLGLPLRQSRHIGDDLLPRLDLRHLLERHRHGGGGVLHRRVSRPRP